MVIGNYRRCPYCHGWAKASVRYCPKCTKPIPAVTSVPLGLVAVGALVLCLLVASSMRPSLGRALGRVSRGTPAVAVASLAAPDGIVRPANDAGLETPSYVAPSAAEQQRLTAAMKHKVDDVEHVTYYTPVGAETKNRRIATPAYSIYLYVGQQEGGYAYPRLVLETHTENWSFWQEVLFLVDGKTLRISVKPDDKRSEFSDGIWESADIDAEGIPLLVARAIGDATSVKVRFAGKYNNDHVLTPAELQRFRDAVAFYDWKRHPTS